MEAGAGAGQTRAIAALTPEQRARLMASARAGAEGDSRTGSIGRGRGSESGKAQEREAGVVGERESRERRWRPSLLFWIMVIAAVAVAVYLLFF